MTISLVTQGKNKPTKYRLTASLLSVFVVCACNAPKEARPSPKPTSEEPGRNGSGNEEAKAAELAPAPEPSSEAPTSADPGTPPSSPEPKAQVVPAPPAASVSASPSSQDACTAKCRGVFARHGRHPEPSCNCRTTDAGKACRDGSECQGACLSDGSQKSVVEAGPPEKGFFLGKCSEFVTSFGCDSILPRGISTKGPYPLDGKPPTRCVD